MLRDRIIWLFIGLLLGSSLACNAFTGTAEPALDLPPPPTSVIEATLPAGTIDSDTEIAPTATLPVDIVTEGTDATAGEALVTMLVNLNVRSGPGVQYDRIGFMLKDESAVILGRDPATGWWKIECPSRVNTGECWVSGGSQYTVGDNTEGVPIAAVPPTPTPPPTAAPESEQDRVIRGPTLVYGGNRGLWMMALDPSQEPLSNGEPELLVASADEITPYISPDGRKVAYLVSQSGDNKALRVINVDGSNDRMLVSSDELPVMVDEGSSTLVANIDRIQWLADSQTIAFNSSFTDLAGTGGGSQEDLWTVSLDGTVTQRMAAGAGGGWFVISGNDQVIISQRQAIIRTNLDGTARETMITFDLVNTASEYIYYPPAQWTVDGRAAYVAIPSQQQFTPDASTTLWRIDRSGPATRLQTISAPTLLAPVRWSTAGNALAYVQQVPGNPPGLPVLTLANGNGQELQEYVSGEQLRFYQWSPDGNHFLYAGQGFLSIGRPGVAASEILVPGEVIDARWLTASAYVVASGSGNSWRLSGGGLSSETTILVTVNAIRVKFDVWMPG